MLSFLFQKPSPVTFRQFRRKGWALFAALGREVRIGVLSLSTLVFALPALSATPAHRLLPPASDAPESSDTVPLAEALVSASRSPLPVGVAARQVTLLTRDAVASAGVAAVSDILRLAAAIDVRQRGAFGIQQDISLDGGTFDQTALLINGIPYDNTQTGHNAAQFPFSLSDIERVEVVEGAASRLFGGQAFSGAINIVTRRHTQGGEASLLTGSYGTYLASVRHAQRFGSRWNATLSASGRRSDGAVHNSDFRGASLFATGGYDDEHLSLFLQAGHVADDFGANTFYSAANNEQWEATRRTLVSLQAETKTPLRLVPSLAWTRTTDHYQWIRRTHSGENFNRTDVYTLGLNAYGQWTLGQTAVGAEMRSENLLSSNLGLPMADTTQWVCVPGQTDIYYTRSFQRTNVSLFVEHNVVLPRWTFSLGLLAQRNSGLDHRFRLFSGIDASWRPVDRLRLFASWNQSQRLPTFTELWYRSPSQQGNQGLQPERNTQWRFGAEWTGTVVTLSGKAHASHGKHMIDWVMYSPDDVYHAAAFRQRVVGFSMHAAVDFTRLSRATAASANKCFLRSVTLSYAFLHQSRRDSEPIFRSAYTMNYLRHKLTATATHRLPFGVNALWTMRLQNRAGAYQVYESLKPTERLKKYGTYALLDLRLTRDIGRLTLSLDLSNLTARRYVDIAGVPQAGLLVLAGVTVRWD